MPRLLSLSCRLYRLLLAAYPASFRRSFGPEMAQVFRDGCRDAIARGRLGGLLSYWARILGDLLATVCRERLAAMDRRASALLLLALLLGLWIGMVDYRSDEVQNAVLLIVVSTLLFGLFAPRRSWRWAIAIGLGVPLVHYIARWIGLKPPYPIQPGMFASFLALIPAFIGTYLGVFFRRVYEAIRRAE
jgi:hypothetical protein